MLRTRSKTPSEGEGSWAVTDLQDDAGLVQSTELELRRRNAWLAASLAFVDLPPYASDAEILNRICHDARSRAVFRALLDTSDEIEAILARG